MAIMISSVSVVQGTGTHVKESVLEVSFNLAADNVGTSNSGHLFSIEAQFKLDPDMAAFAAAILHPYQNAGAGVRYADVPAGTVKVLIRVPTSIASVAGLTAKNWTSALTVQVRAKDQTTQDHSAWAGNAAPVNLKAKRPTIATSRLPRYVGNAGTPVPCNSVPITLTGSNEADAPGNPTWFRYSKLSSKLDDTDTAEAFYNFGLMPNMTFLAGEADGPQVIYVKVYDQYYNSSPVAEFTHDGVAGHYPHLQKAPPSKRLLRIVGSTGREEYTGVKINAEGSFSPERKVTLLISAQSPLPMTYKVLPSSNVEQSRKLFNSPTHPLHGSANNGVNKEVPYAPENVAPEVWLTTDQLNPGADDFNRDVTLQVHVEITDAAGNRAGGNELSKAVRLNTRVYRTANKPLRKPDAFYRHTVRETSGGSDIEIVQNPPIDDSTKVTRSWPDIFYPANHSYPVNEFGEFDETAALNMNNTPTATFDAPLVVDDNGTPRVVYDPEGRPAMNWTRDGSKNYGPMLSADQGSLVYWVIDNTGNGDYQLEFEWFDLHSGAFPPPYNPLAPYRGDVLAVYDASAPGALLPEVNPLTGRTEWKLNDLGLMKEVAAYTGGGPNVYNKTTGQRMGSNDKGGFKTDWMRNRPLLCLVLYTDNGGSGSGFRLKASPRRQETWTNWHVDEKNGEFWVHKHSSIASAAGAADNTPKKVVYQYLDRTVTFDFEAGEVRFNADPAGEVRADFSYYTSGTYQSNVLMASQDDFVEYQPANVFVAQAGENSPSAATRGAVYEDTGNDHGRVTTRVKWDYDRGLLEFPTLSEMPAGRRVFADYSHHTYKRLSSDGYNDPEKNNGDLEFRDPILVPEETEAYPDYSFADIMVVNEGDATLENATLRFVGRGYDTDNNDGVVLLPGTMPGYDDYDDIKDQVLDLNRPWDIQKGTGEETYERMAAAINLNYVWPHSCPKNQQPGQDNPDLYATGIIGGWGGGQKQMPKLPSRGRLFGRAVWVLGGSGGTGYPQRTTAGPKRCSIEIEGSYYTNLTQ